MNKNVKMILGAFVAVILLAGAFSGGFITGHLMPANGLPAINNFLPQSQSPTGDQQASTPGNVQNLFAPFWQAWNIVHQEYVDQPVDDTKLMEGAIRGMMESLGDAHTSYMDPQVYKTEQSSLQGSYEGIGATVDTTGDYLTIISPIEGSPAEKAGIKPGDKVIAIDGQDMTGVDPEQARQKVLGPKGTKVTLTIARKDVQNPIQFTVTRDAITLRSADGKMLENGIAYIDLNQFGDKTTSELRDTLDKLLAQHPKGIVLDLRNNPGGYLNTAIEVASEFIDKGVVVYEKHGNGKMDEYQALGNGHATNIPLVVLINEGSASASEILAGALQDYGRAKLVGVQSYGKGSVQNWEQLSNNEGAVRVTIAHWLTPKQRLIDHIGLAPDVYVPLTADDHDAGRDPQLDTAVQTLEAMINNTAIPTSMPTPVLTPTPVQ